MRRCCAFLLAAGCAGSTAPGITFDPCAPLSVTAAGATPDQRASIDDAIALWQTEGVGIAHADAGSVAIEFRDAAPALYGFYDDTTATVYINTQLVDPAERAITIAHELGHAFGLVHVPIAVRTSVMNPGNVTEPPDDGDRVALVALWGACPN